MPIIGPIKQPIQIIKLGKMEQKGPSFLLNYQYMQHTNHKTKQEYKLNSKYRIINKCQREIQSEARIYHWSKDKHFK